MKVENSLPEPFVYNKYYNKMMAIINSSRQNPPLINFERHHIIPKSYFLKLGLKVDGTKNNLVKLTYEDHMLVHFYASLCANEIIQDSMTRAANNFFKVKNITEEFAKKHSKEIETIIIKNKRLNREKQLNAWIEWNKENCPENIVRYYANQKEKQDKAVAKSLRHIKKNIKIINNVCFPRFRKVLDKLKNTEIGSKKKPAKEALVYCAETGKKYYSLKECAADFNSTAHIIGNIISSARNTSYKGFHILYCDIKKQEKIDIKRNLYINIVRENNGR